MPRCYRPVAPAARGSAGGNARDDPNAGATARPRRPATVAPYLSFTADGLVGIAQRAGATTPGVGGNARRWNQPKGRWCDRRTMLHKISAVAVIGPALQCLRH
jgi:hypothetical protein